MRKKGKIVFWNEAKGYGFIEREKDSKRVFFHVSEFFGSLEKRRKGETVVYAASSDKLNRPCAVNVLPESEKSRCNSLPTKSSKRVIRRKTPNQKSSVDVNAYWLVFIFFVIMGVSVFLGTTQQEIALLYLVMSVVTSIIYARDKSAAQDNRWRISESTLHLLSLTGGWPGALLAQKILRHKSIKTEFRVVFFVTMLINILVLAWVHTSDGAAILSNLLSSISLGNHS